MREQHPQDDASMKKGWIPADLHVKRFEVSRIFLAYGTLGLNMRLLMLSGVSKDVTPACLWKISRNWKKNDSNDWQRYQSNLSYYFFFPKSFSFDFLDAKFIILPYFTPNIKCQAFIFLVWKL